MTSFPLSPAQRAVRVLHDADPTRSRHSTRRIFEVRGPLDVSAFRLALEALVRRHEPLRTIYLSGDRQVVRAEAPQALHLVSRRPPRMPFDLARGPLLSVSVQPLGPDHHEIVLDMHLLAADGWSMQVLLDDLSKLYRAALLGVPASLPELTVQYVDWAAWHATRVTSERRAELVRWWRGALAEYPRHCAGGSLAASGAGRRRAVTLDPGVVSAIHALANSSGHTAFTLLAAACAVALTHRNQQDHLLLGLAVANRDHSAVEQLLGFFVTMTLLPVNLSGDPPFTMLMRRVAEATAAAYAHREVPLSDMTLSEEARAGARCEPLVRVNFAHHPSGSLGTLGLERCEIVEVPVFDTAKFALTIRAEEKADGSCDIWAEYDTSLHGDLEIDALLDSYKAILALVVDCGDSTVSALWARA
ncbi:condensation domain-containing protein [Actinacidiphila glaucinigra]|uniref:condensation domain-containing protein n=1 Tax=Actinacidiphila glaucinigra TaxID=235986 RepID=UPI003D8C315D